MDDENKKEGVDRRAFADCIKKVVAQQFMRDHKKHSDAVNIETWKRLIICVNDQPECLQVLPHITPDNGDKIIIFKTSKITMPYKETEDVEKDQELFRDKIYSQLPAFADWLTKYEVPEDVRLGRFGVKSFHNKEILVEIDNMSYEMKFYSILMQVLPFITKKLPNTSDTIEYYTGTAENIEAILNNSNMAKSLGKLLANNRVHHYLVRLANTIKPQYIQKSSTLSCGVHKWTIYKDPAYNEIIDVSSSDLDVYEYIGDSLR